MKTAYEHSIYVTIIKDHADELARMVEEADYCSWDLALHKIWARAQEAIEYSIRSGAYDPGKVIMESNYYDD